MRLIFLFISFLMFGKLEANYKSYNYYIGLSLSDNYNINNNEVEKYSFVAFKKPFTINMRSNSQLWIKEYTTGEGYIKGVGDTPARVYLLSDLNNYNGLKFRGNIIVIYGKCDEY